MIVRNSARDGENDRRLLAAILIWCLYALLILITALIWGGIVGIVVAIVGGLAALVVMMSVKERLQPGGSGNRQLQ